MSLEQHKAGTLRYCPPELVAGEYFKADPSFDVWSMGVLMYRMLYGEFPFTGSDWSTTKKAIIKGRLKFPKTVEVSKTCKTFIKVFLNKDHNKRPKLYQIAKHPWFNTKK